MKNHGLSERQRVQLREEFNALWKESVKKPSLLWWAREGEIVKKAKEAAWIVFLAGMTSRCTPAKRRRQMEATCAEAMK